MSGRSRVAVAGGGIFGVTAALELASAGFDVHLYEQSADILRAASGINQFRLHRGYHYPRSIETAVSCKTSEATFRAVYGAAVRDDAEHFYAIAHEGSLTPADAFLDFCEAIDLEYETAAPSILARDRAGVCVRVRESLFDADVLRDICRTELRRRGVHVHLGTPATSQTFTDCDFNVIATYASLNELLPERRQRRFQFEVCEKPVVRLPEAFHRKSIVVLDGPFMCIDPIGGGGLFVLGNVVHAIHATNVGERPEIPPPLRPLMNAGIVQPPVTRFPQFIAAAREFFPGIDQAEHVGSMFTVRTVLPGTDRTDERPTLIDRVDDRTLTIFSGKITTCVDAARDVVAMLRGSAPAGPPPAYPRPSSSTP